MNLKGRNFLTLKDFTPEEITYLIDLSAELKAKKKAGELHEYYKGKNIALIFEKTSTRTRCSFEVAAHFVQLCGRSADALHLRLRHLHRLPSNLGSVSYPAGGRVHLLHPLFRCNCHHRGYRAF